MKKKIQLVPSGIPLVDQAWGGFYRGGSYLLVGARKSGRTILALQYAMECAMRNEVCLYFTSVRPKDLLINAASIDFDMQHYMNENFAIVVKVTPPTNIDLAENADDYLVEYIKDIADVVKKYQPSRIVFDELTPFIGFRNLDLLNKTFGETSEVVEDMGVTSLYVVGEAAANASRKVVNVLKSYSTGIINLQKRGEFVSKSEAGKMTIIPQVGHTEGQFSANYFIEPYKGIYVDYKPAVLAESGKPSLPGGEKRYTSVSEFDLPKDTLSLSNIYSLSDFELILNNQVAFYKSTGQVFTLFSICLDESAKRSKLLNINQLQNAVRLSTDKKDKICVVGNKVIVLFTHEEHKDINTLLAEIKNNLPNNDPDYLETIVKLLSVNTIKVDPDIRNAEDLFGQLSLDDPSEKYNPGIS
ncbi:MAG: ATPase domain-containing protein [Ignavibacteriaceae bacterium]|jgi:circadian clock protein KaiC